MLLIRDVSQREKTERAMSEMRPKRISYMHVPLNQLRWEQMILLVLPKKEKRQYYYCRNQPETNNQQDITCKIHQDITLQFPKIIHPRHYTSLISIHFRTHADLKKKIDNSSSINQQLRTEQNTPAAITHMAAPSNRSQR